jgi:UV DNA damage endonuclease
MRLGFAVQVLGKPGLKSSDTRRWQNRPHLSVSLAYLRDILLYLRDAGIHMYRMSSDLAPYVTHPDLPQFHNQIEECAEELAAIGQIARQGDLRLSFHPAAYIVLNSPAEGTAEKAATELMAQARMLDLMGLGPHAVVVTHVGGLYGDKTAAMNRFVQRYLGLPEPVRRRLVLENDDRTYTIADTYHIHERTGIRLIFDTLHYLCNPTKGMTFQQALETALSTWPGDQAPKVHFSSPCTALLVREQKVENGHKQRLLREPRVSHHADLIDPFSFINFLQAAGHTRDFDVMLECKAKDVALLRLRSHLERFAPELLADHSVNQQQPT